jgi:flagellar protein FlaG
MKRTFCEFAYNEDTKRVSIKLVDDETKEVIKEIPPEETLEMIAKMWELAGILVDERR